MTHLRVVFMTPRASAGVKPPCFSAISRSPRSRAIRDGLAERGILVREVGHYPGLAGCLRLSVGSGPALRATREALREILGEPAEEVRR